MAKIYFFPRRVTLDLEEKWTQVKMHYSEAYPKQAHLFETRLQESAVEHFYNQMLKLQAIEREYLKRATHQQIRKFQALSQQTG
jgi:transketolase